MAGKDQEPPFEREESVSWDDQVRRTRRLCALAFALETLILALSFACIGYVALYLIVGHSVTGMLARAPHTIALILLLDLVIATLVTGTVMARADVRMIDATGARLHEQTKGVVYDCVEEMAVAAGCDMPTVYIADTPIANAYATSDGKHSAIVVTTGLLSVVDRDGLQGVIGHEMGHLVSGDCPSMTKLVALTGIVGALSVGALRLGSYHPVAFGEYGDGDDNDDEGSNAILGIILLVLALLFIILAPLFSKLVETKSSRDRERRADAYSAKLTRNPTALARALLALDAAEPTVAEDSKGFYKGCGALAFRVPKLADAGLLATHPATEERIQTLVNMGADPTETRRPVRLTVSDMMD